MNSMYKVAALLVLQSSPRSLELTVILVSVAFNLWNDMVALGLPSSPTATKYPSSIPFVSRGGLHVMRMLLEEERLSIKRSVIGPGAARVQKGE